MSYEWGRAPEAGKWQRAVPVWLMSVIVTAVAAGVAVWLVRQTFVWTPLQQFYLSAYARGAVASSLGVRTGRYRVLMIENRRGSRLAIDDEVVPIVPSTGETTFALSELAHQAGSGRLVWRDLVYDHARLHAQLQVWIYTNQSLTDLARPSLITVFVVLIGGLLIAIPKDVQWARSRRHGRRLKGPELVSTRQFNRRTRANGIAFVQVPNVPAKLVGLQAALAIPRAIESSHFLIMGDSGTGKSALIRQLLGQLEDRGDTAIAEEFQSAREDYYTDGDQIRGVWYGQLANRWDLVGQVRKDQFQRLADGQHPITGEQLVRHQTAHETRNARRETVTTMEHRAGWDATFSAPKSVSITALVGGDSRVRDAHRESVRVALSELEPYVQARLGGNRRPETTGNTVAALFEHDSARPVSGYAAPQLHTHAVIFNLTETPDGTVRPLQPRELYRTQQYATAVYRSELAARLTALGYEIERGRSGQPEIRGYSREYLDASSPRRQQIEAYLANEDRQGAAAAQIAAHQTREAKVDVSHEEMQRRHQGLAERFGSQPTQVMDAAERRGAHHAEHDHEPSGVTRTAVTFARDRNLEREAVVDERAILRDALHRSLGEARIEDMKQEIDRRVERSEFIPVQEPSTPGRSFTTPAMLELERETIDRMRAGQGQYSELVTDNSREAIMREYDHLNEGQRTAVREILASRDQVMALEGTAGTGKTTALAAVRDAAEREGYQVEGFAPTSRAAHKLAEAGIESSTLQGHLARGEEDARPTDQKRLYVLDESSLASTTQMHTFLERLGPEDRVLLVGDMRQHEAVDAGRPYHQLQETGIRTVHLDEIVRQRDPELKAVVEQLSRGEVQTAVERLDHQGRVHEIGPRVDRLTAIANEYVKDSHATLVVSPDNQSRQDLNDVIHRAMQREGHVDREEHYISVLVPRQEITGADRQWAERYDPGDVVRYSRGSKALGIEAGDYARVEHVDAKTNHVTVRTDDERTVSYDPRRLQGVTLYRETERAFAAGDRVQSTAPDRVRDLANREPGTVERIDANGQMEIRWDSGGTSSFESGERRHLDYGYAVTSHSSQGQTAGRVLVHVETAARAGEKLVNQRFAYVAVSRGQYDARIYTDDKVKLARALDRDVSHRSALERTPGHASR